jgi:tyrosine-protein phosphatase YwqE
MDKNFDTELDEIKNLLEKKSKEDKTSEKPVELEFEQQFDHINNDFISPAVAIVNKKFEDVGYYLKVIPGSEVYSDVRKALQIILTFQGKQIDFLNDPSIIIEGFPKSGNIRIATSGSTSGGVTRPVRDVDKSLIENSIFDFLKSAV